MILISILTFILTLIEICRGLEAYIEKLNYSHTNSHSNVVISK